jgi:hypothetical protein
MGRSEKLSLEQKRSRVDKLLTLPPSVASTFLTSVAFCNHSRITPIGGVNESAPCKLPAILSGFHSALILTRPLLQPDRGHQSRPASCCAPSRSSSRSAMYPINGSLRKSRSSMILTTIFDAFLSEQRNSTDSSQTGLTVCFIFFLMPVLRMGVVLLPRKTFANGLRSPRLVFDWSRSFAWWRVRRTMPTSNLAISAPGYCR